MRMRRCAACIGLGRRAAASADSMAPLPACQNWPTLLAVTRSMAVSRPRLGRLPAGDQVVEQVDDRIVALAVRVLADRGRDDAADDIGHRLVDEVVADDRQLPGQAGIDHGLGRSAAGDGDVDTRQPRVALQRRGGDGAHLAALRRWSRPPRRSRRPDIAPAGSPRIPCGESPGRYGEGGRHDQDLAPAVEGAAHGLAAGLALQVPVAADVERRRHASSVTLLSWGGAFAEPGDDPADPVAQAGDLGGPATATGLTCIFSLRVRSPSASAPRASDRAAVSVSARAIVAWVRRPSGRATVST